MNIWIASDHGGYKLKSHIFNELKLRDDYVVHDLGCYTNERCDYPDFAKQVCKSVNELGGFGILVCTTGQGMCMTANAQPNIRAALVHDIDSATKSREHNNANVMCIGEKYCTNHQATEWIQLFLKTPFSNEERHARRVEQIKNKV